MPRIGRKVDAVGESFHGRCRGLAMEELGGILVFWSWLLRSTVLTWASGGVLSPKEIVDVSLSELPGTVDPWDKKGVEAGLPPSPWTEFSISNSVAVGTLKMLDVVPEGCRGLLRQKSPFDARLRNGCPTAGWKAV